MSISDDLAEIKASIESVWATGYLLPAVQAALDVPRPSGDPEELGQYGRAFVTAGREADLVHTAVQNVASRGLPEVWVGATSALASDVISAVATGVDDSARLLGEAGREFDILGDDLAEAKTRHESGRWPLLEAATMLNNAPFEGRMDPFGSEVVVAARAAALEGVDHMLAAATMAETATTRFVGRLNEYSAAAKAERMTGGGMTAADKVVLGEAAVPGAIDDQTILSVVDMERASKAMDELSADERAGLNALLAAAKSPQELAYLLKALAAGHSVDEVAAFDVLIHAKGDNAYWLRDRLSPASAQSTMSQMDVEYLGKDWTQGPHPTCVASSTVLARALVDPLYALQLTTGGHPGDPEHDNADAFADRLRDEQQRLYEDARPWNADAWIIGYDGVDSEGGEKIADSQIAAHSGGDYEKVDFDSSEDRRDALPDIYNAVDQGQPVPVGISGDDGGHQVMIIGHDGDRLQVYNPWGHTIWIDADDFVNNHMDKVAAGLPDVDDIQLPR